MTGVVPDNEAALVGFVGLGNMGTALCANLVASGVPIIAFDIAGTEERAPESALCAASLAEVASASVVVLSLPDGKALAAVTDELLGVSGRRTTHVVDTSTVGTMAAHQAYRRFAEGRITYVDAPVSGGVAGAKKRTVAIMFAGDDRSYHYLTPVLAGMSDRCFHVGEQPGMGQVMKMANNFLSATALAATSEAVAFGVAAGLDPSVMVEVLNGSSGQSSATTDKFPNHVINGRYASGFTNDLMAKDLSLYRDAVTELGTTFEVGATTVDVWERFAEAEPGADFTRIYPFVKEYAS
jgi:3-hydroxyisobutyrate dehydrogenase